MISVTMLPWWRQSVAIASQLTLLSAGQSIVSNTYYQRIAVEANTWSDIRAHTLTGYVKDGLFRFPSTFNLYQCCFGRSARFQCAAICSANVNCVAYYYESSECHESNGIGVIGASSDSQATRTVYIDDSLEPGSFLLLLSEL